MSNKKKKICPCKLLFLRNPRSAEEGDVGAAGFRIMYSEEGQGGGQGCEEEKVTPWRKRKSTLP